MRRVNVLLSNWLIMLYSLLGFMLVGTPHSAYCDRQRYRKALPITGGYLECGWLGTARRWDVYGPEVG